MRVSNEVGEAVSQRMITSVSIGMGELYKNCTSCISRLFLDYSFFANLASLMGNVVPNPDVSAFVARHIPIHRSSIF